MDEFAATVIRVILDADVNSELFCDGRKEAEAVDEPL